MTLIQEYTLDNMSTSNILVRMWRLITFIYLYIYMYIFGNCIDNLNLNTFIICVF